MNYVCCCRKSSQFSRITLNLSKEFLQTVKYQNASEAEKSQLMKEYGSTPGGLTTARHDELLIEKGYNIVSNKPRCEALRHFIESCINIFNALLVSLSIVTYMSGDDIGASIILGMIILSVVTGFVQERRSNNAVEKLQRQVSVTSIVYRLVPKGQMIDVTSEWICDIEITKCDSGHFHHHIDENQLHAQNLQRHPQLMANFGNYQSDNCIFSQGITHTYVCVKTKIPTVELVEGDIIALSTGDMIPADSRLLTAKDLFVSQSSLTGESMPVEKHADHQESRESRESKRMGHSSSSTEQKQNKNTTKTLMEYDNLILTGSTVISGTATALVISTGKNTYFGLMAQNITKHPKTSFEKGIQRFVFMMLGFMVVICISTLLINGFIQRDWVGAYQFAIVVAIGLTPEMLPMIITLNLAKGAISMSKVKVIVKHLRAIQNLGAMDILCTDKTGTLTQDHIVLDKYLNILGNESPYVLEYAHYNSYYQTGFKNLLDKAILNRSTDLPYLESTKDEWRKIDELPFDFERRRMSVIIGKKTNNREHILICKGAVEEILDICQTVLVPKDQVEYYNNIDKHSKKMDFVSGNETIRKEVQKVEKVQKELEIKINSDSDKKTYENMESRPIITSPMPDIFEEMVTRPLTESSRKIIIQKTKDLNMVGLRVICVAIRRFNGDMAHKKEYHTDSESDLSILGFVAFLDPPKPETEEALVALKNKGVNVKVLTGDNELVAKSVCRQVGLDVENILMSNEIANLDDEELLEKARQATVFCKLTPMQKDRIVKVLQSGGHTVGFLGDGINDSLAIRSADVGISVDNATDIAKESASIILLEKSLLVLSRGVVEGRKVFANIIKYIKMGASSNLGNVISITGFSIFLPFIPMQPVQLLVQNLLYDFSQIGISFDNVDEEFLDQPRKWEIGDIAKFMIFIGPISSIFDYCTYAIMWYYFGANSSEHEVLFQTGWFVEGLVTQTLIVHAIRTTKIPFIQSRASASLSFFTIVSCILAIVIIYIPIVAPAIPFEGLPLQYYPFLIGMMLMYFVLVQFAKILYNKCFNNDKQKITQDNDTYVKINS